VLTSLQEQNIDEAAVKLKAYREARAAAGFDPSTGRVTMMMHTFLGADKGAALEKARKPLTNYLRSHVELIKTSAAHKAEAAKNLPTQEAVDSLVAFAFERYYRTASLIGAPHDCLPMIERLKSIGITEVACLVDFGVDVESSLEALKGIAVLRQLSGAAEPPDHRARVQAELMALLQQRFSATVVPNALLIVDELPVKDGS